MSENDGSTTVCPRKVRLTSACSKTNRPYPLQRQGACLYESRTALTRHHCKASLPRSADEQNLGFGAIHLTTYPRASEGNLPSRGPRYSPALPRWQDRANVGSPGPERPCLPDERDLNI